MWFQQTKINRPSSNDEHNVCDNYVYYDIHLKEQKHGQIFYFNLDKFIDQSKSSSALHSIFTYDDKRIS